jgi:DNA-binding transcriptional regulator LsrR (DeoR family)
VTKQVKEDPRKLAEVARDYYLNQLTQRVIAKRHGVNQSTVAHWLRRARDRGIIAIDIDADFGLSGLEHRERSRQLRDKGGLRECFVVEPGDSGLYNDARSDDLHTVIANVSGPRLREWIQSGDHLVIGGGRAPVRVARFIKRAPPSRREVRISPLSGRIWTGSWQEDGFENLRRPLDADDAARLLGFAFEHEPGTRFGQIGHPLYAEEEGVARRIIEGECVFRPEQGWNLSLGIQAPVRALVGVGVFDPSSGHRINELLRKINRDPMEQFAPHLHWAARRFDDAVQFVQQQGLPYFGDIANRLFPTLPLPEDLIGRALPSPNVYERLSTKLDELNRRAVVMDWAHLRGVPSVWAVAGGALKVRALWTLLICRRLESSGRSGIVKELSTDIRTAIKLEDALDAFDKAPQDLRNWYSTIAPLIFAPSGDPETTGEPVGASV